MNTHLLLSLVCAALLSVLAATEARAIEGSPFGLPFPSYVITLASNATDQDKYAATRLAADLGAVFHGVTFRIVDPGQAGSLPQLAVGPDAALATGCVTSVDLVPLGWEGYILSSDVSPHLCLTGGRSSERGTIYAVLQLLEDIGYRWYAAEAEATRIPDSAAVPGVPYYNGTAHMPASGDCDRPLTAIHTALEYRDHDQMIDMSDPFGVNSRLNGMFAANAAAEGGHYTYAGSMFVHTYYRLVPPDQYLESHPGWFSLIDGKRTATDGGGDAQLCLTNDTLLEFVIDQVRAILQANPDSKIISVSQNDHNGGNCQCDRCKAAEEAAGGHASGPVLTFVNKVAGALKADFPDVAFDTLAYQYTRQPPLNTTPADNVIVRLCSIECNFGAPFTDPSNAPFRADLDGWAKISKRLYIWDYVTDFSHYVLPFPNWHVIGPNIKYLAEHSVRGIFEEGDYTSKGGEMVPLKGYLMARMLWDPEADDLQIINEFLSAYYSTAAPYVVQYMNTMEASVQQHGFYLTEHTPVDAPFLNINTLASAAESLLDGLTVLGGVEPYSQRMRVAILPVYYVFLMRWRELCLAAHLEGVRWPIDESAQSALDTFSAVFEQAGGTKLNEGDHDLGWLAQQVPRSATCHRI